MKAFLISYELANDLIKGSIHYILVYAESKDDAISKVRMDVRGSFNIFDETIWA